MSFELTPDETGSYERDGFVVRQAVLAHDEVAELRDAAERAAALAASLVRMSRIWSRWRRTSIEWVRRPIGR